MNLQSRLLSDTVQLAPGTQVLFVNSAADPFVPVVLQRCSGCAITLAEDNIAAVHMAMSEVEQAAPGSHPLRHIAFHEYMLHEQVATMDVAIMGLLYQPGKAWIEYGLQLAFYALKPGGKFYVVGAKDRGILTVAKHMQERFGNAETLAISKGHRVICSSKPAEAQFVAPNSLPIMVFAQGQLDEGTRLLLDALEVRATDDALDIGCGAGIIGLHIARLASKGSVTMVDASLVAVTVAERNVAESGLPNVRVLASDGAQAVFGERFDLVVTNPPFHQGGMQTTEIAERFIREAAQVLRPSGRFYLVANRFLKYEPTLQACFRQVQEVGGNGRYKVLRALQPRP